MGREVMYMSMTMLCSTALVIHLMHSIARPLEQSLLSDSEKGQIWPVAAFLVEHSAFQAQLHL